MNYYKIKENLIALWRLKRINFFICLDVNFLNIICHIIKY